MKIETIGDARTFSLERIQKNELVEIEGLAVDLLCFEAGQRDEEATLPTSVVYQVLEGEALVRLGDSRSRLGKGQLAAVPPQTPHVLENAGGGLLVVMATRAK